MALKGINAYKKGNLKQEIAQADPHKLTLMLMQGALERMAYAKGCIERQEYAEKAQHIGRCTAILINLRDTLDLSNDAEVAENLFSLYDYMAQRLTDATVQNSVQLTLNTHLLRLNYLCLIRKLPPCLTVKHWMSNHFTLCQLSVTGVLTII